MFIVTDYYEGGDLGAYLEQRGYFEESEVFQFMKQVVNILLYFKDKMISHRDIKLQNFLLEKKDSIQNIKLIDFGFSKNMADDSFADNIAGTPYFVAPEILNKMGNMISDIWSVGVNMYILLSGKVPFPGRTQMDILTNVLNMPLNFDSKEFLHVSIEAKDLIKKMLDRNVNTRITPEGMIKHDWYLFFYENEVHFINVKKEIRVDLGRKI